MNSRKKACAVAFSVWACLMATRHSMAQQWSVELPGGYFSVERQEHSAVLAQSANRLVTFGGFNTSSYVSQLNLNDVWALTNANGLGGTGQWINLIPDGASGSPLARHGHSAVYDSSNDRMSVFAGCNGFCLPILDDVWVLTNASGTTGTPAWLQLSPTGGPPPGREFHTATYDPNTNSMTIFGGDGGFSSKFSDVWVLSNANGLGGTPSWTQLTPSGGPPTGQGCASAVYDSTNNIMTVFAGATSTGQFTNAVWVLSHANGTGGAAVWAQLIAEGAPGSPPDRECHTATYDQGSNRMTIFGGENRSGVPLGGVYVLSSANGLGGVPAWTKLTLSGVQPAPRSSHKADYDATDNRMIIYGGGSYEGIFFSTWVLTHANGL